MSIQSRMTWITLALVLPAMTTITATEPERPNVLFISIDDLNDWVGPFHGNDQSATPNIDRFAKQGSVVFQNAHCAGPVCGPSRSALLSGFMPSTTGIYGNSQNMLHSDWVQKYATLPEYFAKQGYDTLSKGKIFHAHAWHDGLDRGQWAFQHWEPTERGTPVDKNQLYSRNRGIINGVTVPGKKSGGGGSEFAWGPTVGGLEETSDFKTAQWAAQELVRPHDQPFFLAVGISKPHLPFNAPQEYFDRWSLDEITIPEYRLDDLDDIMSPDGKKIFKPSEDFLWVSQDEQLFRSCVRAYLAACSFADDCVGEVLRGLQEGPHADNTIVVIWGDHGWHLGEKLRFRKATLWHEATRMPLIIRLPGMHQQHECVRPVNLIDLYPTLIELCNLPEKEELDGRSIASLLKDSDKPWPYPSVTIRGQGNASIHDERWHYIRYRDGTEELYDLEQDPLEHRNLASLTDPAVVAVKHQLRKWIPLEMADDIPQSNKNKNTRGFSKEVTSLRDLQHLK